MRKCGNHASRQSGQKSDDDGGARTRIITDILSDTKDSLPVLGTPDENRYIYRYIIDGTISMILSWIDNGFDLTTEQLAGLISDLGCITIEKMDSGRREETGKLQ